MTIEWTWKVTDVAIIAATLLGPVFAVQAQKWLERGRAIRDRRMWIFRVLMSTRAARLSSNHVEALNAVPIEFYGTDKRLRAISDAWKSYFDHLSTEAPNQDLWNQKWNDLFVDLLHLISQFLGYEFSRVEIAKEIYAPKGHAAIESDQDIIRRGLAGMFAGKFAIPMDLKSFPVTPEAAREQDAVRQALLRWLSGTATVGVEIKPVAAPDEQGI